MTRLSDAWLDELRARVNMVDLVGEYVALKPKGNRYWGRCPFHNEKTPSFSVSPDSQLYYCFGCHKGGNVIHFVMEMERMEFMDAVKLLAERVHMDLPQREEGPGIQEREAARERREKIYAANQAAARYFHQLLWTPEGAKALAYLHKRGLDDRDIRRFGLGCAGSDWEGMTNALCQAGIEEQILVEAGLTLRRESRRFDMFRERAIFPIIDAQGRVLGFGGRAMGDAQPKYLNTSDTPVFNKRQGLYAMNLVKKERGLTRLVLVEGYMDVVSLRKYGVPGVVATLGTALTQEQARLMKRYAPQVVLAYDGDQAGQKAILRGLDICQDQGLDCRVLVFPDGQDPDEFIRAQGLEGFQGLKTMKPVEYRMLRAKDGLDMSQQEGRTQYAIACCQLLKQVGNPVELDVYLNRLTIETGFSREVLDRQIGVTPRLTGTEAPLRQPRRPQEAPEDEEQRAQGRLVALLGAGLIAPETVKAEDFDEPLYRQMASLLLSGHSAAAVLDQVEEGVRPRAARVLNQEVMPDEQKALSEAEDCLCRIRAGRAAREVERMREALKTAQGGEKTALLKRIQQLTKAK